MMVISVENKKLLTKIYLVIFFGFSLFFLDSFGIVEFDKVKEYANTNLNIRKISEIYQGDILTFLGKDIRVSQDSGINVKEIYENEQNLTICTFNKNVESPVEGLVVKKNAHSYVIQGTDNNEYLFYDLNTVKVSIYEYVYKGQIVGTSKVNQGKYYYQVCFNKNSKKDIYECLYYIVEYEEA